MKLEGRDEISLSIEVLTKVNKEKKILAALNQNGILFGMILLGEAPLFLSVQG